MTDIEKLAKDLADAGADVLRNFEMCPQNPHNAPTVAHRYLKALREAVVAYDEVMRKN